MSVAPVGPVPVDPGLGGPPVDPAPVLVVPPKVVVQATLNSVDLGSSVSWWTVAFEDGSTAVLSFPVTVSSTQSPLAVADAVPVDLPPVPAPSLPPWVDMPQGNPHDAAP